MRLIIVGCGQRGTNYALYATEFPDVVTVVAAADPNEQRLAKLSKVHNIPKSSQFRSWVEILKKPKFADAVAICTQDKLHCEPTVAFAKAGYNILLEKPMAVSIPECKMIFEAIRESNVILSVGHVLRYTSLYRKVKSIIDSGELGDIISINHMECIGYWHFAHSFVRGNWRKEEDSTFSLMAKSCHDIDLILYFMNGAKPTHVSSFGSLNHFRPEKKPSEAGSARRCMDCKFEKHCPFSAKKVYLEPASRGIDGWPVSVITDNVTQETVIDALQKGPYGKCVYECDNDVVDNQVVSMNFDGGQTATFSMVAFTEDLCVRKTRIFGSKGELVCDGHSIRLFKFEGDEAKVYGSQDFPLPNSVLSGHFGGDFYLMDAFVSAVCNDNPSVILSGPEETFHSHLLVFAAEHARKTKSVVDFKQFLQQMDC